MPSSRVRLARDADIQAMRNVERAAGVLFLSVGMPDVAAHDPPSVGVLHGYVGDGRAWVSVGPSGEPVGYALVDLLESSAHLEQISVRPEHGRCGRGRELFDAVCGYALAHGRTRVTLSTFRDVPWNAPLYARWGLRPLAAGEMGAELADVAEHEEELGLDPAARVIMAIDV